MSEVFEAESTQDDAGQGASERFGEAAQVTTRYIADQPVRSVLVAAAAGAAITALLVLATRHSRDDY